jgi:enamine deaminase RidA (YjgF/YER057c/UK114 family)
MTHVSLKAPFRALSLAAALAVLPLSSAVAEDQKTSSEAAIEAAAAAFEARMEAFGARAEAISEDKSLSEAAREIRIAALWAEYQPEVTAFTAEITRQAGQIAQQALANIDVEALVAQAMNDPEVQQTLRGAAVGAHGLATNGAWASNDPEHLATYGLIAQYALDQASDAVVAAEAADSDAD